MDTIIAAAMSNLLAFGYPTCKDDVKVRTTQSAEYSPAFFTVRISSKKIRTRLVSSWAKERTMHKQMYAVLTTGAVMAGLFL